MELGRWNLIFKSLKTTTIGLIGGFSYILLPMLMNKGFELPTPKEFIISTTLIVLGYYSQDKTGRTHISWIDLHWLRLRNFIKENREFHKFD